MSFFRVHSTPHVFPPLCSSRSTRDHSHFKDSGQQRKARCVQGVLSSQTQISTVNTGSGEREKERISLMPFSLWCNMSLCILSHRWTRREEADFYRVVSTFGVIFDPVKQQFDWNQFRAFARLDKKSDESLEKYFSCFVAMCRRVCRMPAKPDDGRYIC